MAILNSIEHGLFKTYFTYEVMRDDYSSRREFEDYEEARDYYNQLQALDNQEESLRLQREEMKRNQEERERKRKIEDEERERSKRMRPPRPLQQPVPQPAVRKCAKCGSSLLDDSIFCHNCGARRKKCSCGGFLDAGMKFCTQCGKPTPEEEKRQAERRAEEIRRVEEARIAEQKRQEEARRQEEERKKWEMEVKANCIDRGDYIELVHPVGNIRMIEKMCSPNEMTWYDAMQYAKNLRKGGFSDWRVPTLQELNEIYKIKYFCGINYFSLGSNIMSRMILPHFWSSSCEDMVDDDGGGWWCYYYVYDVGGYLATDYVEQLMSGSYYVRCVR